MGISIRQLQVFDAVAHHGSISKGASELGMSQSSASAALAEFQHAVGKSLLAKSAGQAARLTSDGLRIWPQIRGILKDLSALRSFEGQLEYTGLLVVGASSTIGDSLLPRLCADFRSRYPDVTLNIVMGSDGELISALEHLELETALIENSTSVTAIELTRWRQDELWLIAPPTHPLAHMPNLEVRNFAGAQWCLRERSSSISIRLKLLLQAPLGRLSTVLEIASNSGLIEAVAAGVGVGCVSSELARPAVDAGRVVRLEPIDFNFSRDFHLARPRGVRRDHLAAAFDAFILEQRA